MTPPQPPWVDWLAASVAAIFVLAGGAVVIAAAIATVQWLLG